MKAVFRVDGTSKIGLGHVSRCLNLAEELKFRGVRCTFIARALPRVLSARILQLGFQIANVNPAGSTNRDLFESADLHPIDAEQDAAATITRMSGTTDWLIVDNYELDHVWEDILRPHTRWILAIDDLADRRHNCDVIIDQNFRDDADNPYAELTPQTCLQLIGPRYALLPSPFGRTRKNMRSTLESRSGALIFFGGGADQGLTEIALTAMASGSLAKTHATVVIGGSNPESHRLFRMARLRPRTVAVGAIPHLADLMSTAAVGIGAGGVTSLERLCLGLPSVVTTIAENQIRTTERQAGLGLLRYLGHWTAVDSAMIAESTESILQDTHWRQTSSARAMSLVDGGGASRVAREMLTFFNRA